MEQTADKIEKIDKKLYPLRQCSGTFIGLVPAGFLWLACGILIGVAIFWLKDKRAAETGAIMWFVLALAAFIGGVVLLVKVRQGRKVLFAANSDHVMIWQNDRYLKFQIDEITNYFLHFRYVHCQGDNSNNAPYFSSQGKIELIVRHNSYVADGHDLTRAHEQLRYLTGRSGQEIRREEWRFKD